ncbi:type II secretion system protein [bacterium]|nr:type II secretion system protein [bacterium]
MQNFKNKTVHTPPYRTNYSENSVGWAYLPNNSPHLNPPRPGREIAFTLAEVLITLVIIGVIAAITVPTLMNKIGDRQTVVALKKAYTEINQAFNLAQSENGKISTWGLIDEGGVNHTKLAQILKPYFKLMKICPSNEGPTCFAQTQYKNLAGDNWINGSNSDACTSAQTVDGKAISFEVFNYCGTDTSERFGSSPINSKICADIFVDINGAKKPNILGRDVFSFYLSDYGVVPRGTKMMESGTANLAKFSTDCNRNSSGYSCAGWVIYNENMDYLHCDDLSWDGKLKC